MPRAKSFDETEVLERAMELFWKRGFHATSIRDLVEHLGINRASLYDTFGDKEQLFQRAFAHYRVINQGQFDQLLQAHGSVRDGIKALFEAAIRKAAADPDARGCFAVNCATEMAASDAVLQSMLSENKLAFEQSFAEYLRRGIERGELSEQKDPEALAMMLFTLYNGLEVIAKFDADPKKLLHMVDAALDALD
jgi:TetR/AcrR family transcriptional repressor of nem operon